MEYPKTVKPSDVVNGDYAPGLFRIKGKRALYDEVWMADGGKAVYLHRVTFLNSGFYIHRR